MLTYTFYKTFHLLFILILFTSIGFVSLRSELMQKKAGKLLLGLIFFMILVGGMGLLARIGFKHNEPFPLWVKLKFSGWFVLAGLMALLFKLQSRESRWLTVGVILAVAWFVVWVAIYKPL